MVAELTNEFIIFADNSRFKGYVGFELALVQIFEYGVAAPTARLTYLVERHPCELHVLQLPNGKQRLCLTHTETTHFRVSSS